MSQKNIKIKIGDRVYPLTISDSEENGVNTSVKNIDAVSVYTDKILHLYT